MTQDEKAIRELVDTWMAATRAKDLDTILSLMSDDMLFLVPGQPPFGKKEFEAGSRSAPDYKFEGSAEILEMKILGDWAWIRNKIDVSITMPGQAPMKKSGYTLSILRKENGKWRLTRDANLVM